MIGYNDESGDHKSVARHLNKKDVGELYYAVIGEKLWRSDYWQSGIYFKPLGDKWEIGYNNGLELVRVGHKLLRKFMAMAYETTNHE